MCWWANLSSAVLDTLKVATSVFKAVPRCCDGEVRFWLTGDAALGQVAVLSEASLGDVIKRSAAGEDLTFCILLVRSGAIGVKPGDVGYVPDTNAVAKACDPTMASEYGPVLVSWQAFPTGQDPPCRPSRARTSRTSATG